jgi:acyl-CoA synthetase (AMP-forming)/AMP-acid ligase II
VGGRVSEFINLGGIKLDPTLLDAVAAEAANLNAATQIASFGYVDARGQTKLGFAYLQALKPNLRAIEKALARKYHLKDILFMPLATLPTNESGKVKRSTLGELAGTRTSGY